MAPSGGMPVWLEKLLAEKFFVPCEHHEGVKKNEKNILCLDCCLGFCSHCIPPHRAHRLLQIRRYVYHDVVRVEDLEKLIDMSLVQSYTTNSAKVAFLKQRTQNRPFRGTGNGCRSCDRPLQESYQYCSLSCKVKQLVMNEGDLLRNLRKCEYLPFSIDDDGHLTPDSILESTGPDDSASTASGCERDVTTGSLSVFPAAAADTPIPRRRPMTEPKFGSFRKRPRKMSRPNRSPMM
ncbi:hypothetical protein HPP92_021996 [Vanilla planifolia]|uniref:PLATZ transcription factor family protein n=1 Tax=Vanilla planifolia TaxID=51239 RepID=A0A835PW96_VANPL|nr:hypothetical protein HPP92_022309 [Vanilla planifolia]KAG0458868.1 hypothetical protein HPP92_021996 [Vanilla planifolia]